MGNAVDLTQSRRWLAVALLLVAPAASAAGLLHGRAPLRANDVATPERLTDGLAPGDGAGWDHPLAARLPAGAFVEWDLGRVAIIRAASLQGDNNDAYVVSFSEDGQRWLTGWRTPAPAEPGLRTRYVGTLEARARFVRLTAEGGDGYYSVSELELFETTGEAWRARVLSALWYPTAREDLAWTAAVLVTALVLLVVGQRSRRAVVWGGAAVLVATGVAMVKVAFDVPGVSAPRLDFMRAAVAALAFVAVLRERLFTSRHPAHGGLVLGVLGATALLGVLCFLNLGRPQFYDAGRGKMTYLHFYDSRTYYPIAKYFPELRFDGVYAASVAAVADDAGGLDAFANTPLRDLRTHANTTVAASRQHVEAVRARFTPERWAEFKEDMRPLRAAMGDAGFLGSMNDHGGNATPVWFLTARALFVSGRASDAVLWRGVVLDGLLLLLAFAALFHAFGARTALVAMTVFGAMDFYMFGSNWVGAPLRHDWLSLWCLGLAALKKERFRLAGVLLVWAALIRAFPALTFVTLVLPAAWSLVRMIFARLLWTRSAAVPRSPLFLREWLRESRGLFHVALGAAVGGTLLLLASVAVFGASAWPEWFRKVRMLDADGHLNNIAVRAYVTSKPLALGLILAGAALLSFIAARRARLHEAAAYSVLLVPIVFNTANYYMHCAFLLVVLAGPTAHRRALPWLALLGMCVASFFTSLSGDMGRHFRLDTGVMLAAFAVVLLAKVVASFQDRSA